MILKKLTLFTAVFLVSQGIYAKELYPKEVSDFIEKRDTCDYFRGEVSGEPDIDNARHLNKQLDKYCKGTDQLLKKLKLKYKNHKSVLEKLNTYDLIECTANCSNDSEEQVDRNPKFSDYPVTNVVSKTIDKYSANFAGHYSVSTKGCGGGAICGEITDIITGKVVASFPNAYLIEDDNGSNYFTANYQPDSSLIIISGIAADTETDSNNNVLGDIYRVRYYNFLNGKLILVHYDENIN